MPQTNEEETETPSANTLPFPAKPETAARSNPLTGNHEKLVLGLIPFTPVQFSGSDSLIAWGRLAGYGILAYYTYNKIRPLSYAAMGAFTVSLATSLLGKAWSK